MKKYSFLFLIGLLMLPACVRTDVDELQSDRDVGAPVTTLHSPLSSDYYWFFDQKIPLTATGRSFKLYKGSAATRARVEGEELVAYSYGAVMDSTGSVFGMFSDGASRAGGQPADAEEIYSIPCFRDDGDNDVLISNLFYVLLKKSSDRSLLDAYAAENNLILLEEDRVVPLLYTLVCTASSRGNALEMANLFHETGRFEAVAPDFMGRRAASAGDPLYGDQWNLRNTGQKAVSNGYDETYTGTPGIDIGYEQAKPYLPASSDVVVAVIDTGVEVGHPDLSVCESWDAINMTSPCRVLNKHGTCCAGIIGAVANNGIGLTGIAPVGVMAISINLGQNQTGQDLVISRAIDYAVAHGADVLSNSWGGGAYSELIASRLNNALAEGRDGKGCVVVFSSGNDNRNDSSFFPGATNPDYLCVGAMNPNGKRVVEHFHGAAAWGSNYGSSLDVVAPGTGIHTTALYGSYTGAFNGTSAACPHVAGIAAVLLSIDPDLSFRQVNDLIESSATKPGGYPYSVQSARPNGTWHQEVGYGLVNIYNAVMAATTPLTLSGVDFTGDVAYRRRALSFTDIAVSGQGRLEATSISDYLRFNTLRMKDAARLNASSASYTEWTGISIAGSAQAVSSSQGRATLAGVELSGSGKLSVAAGDIVISPGFSAAKGTDLALRIE